MQNSGHSEVNISCQQRNRMLQGICSRYDNHMNITTRQAPRSQTTFWRKIRTFQWEAARAIRFTVGC